MLQLQGHKFQLLYVFSNFGYYIVGGVVAVNKLDLTYPIMQQART